jgi:hypothetical protein
VKSQSISLQITARPKLPAGGQVPRATPEAEYSRPHRPEQRVSRKRSEELDAAAELDRICATRPLKPPSMPNHDNRTRSAGALALAREIRRGSYTP